MAKQASKTVIGVFVISSIAMLVVGVIIFGSGDIFKKKRQYVLFFEDSVKGLTVGAPVIWRGVKVGAVSSIVLRANPKNYTINVPVIIDVDPNTIEVAGERGILAIQLKNLIKKGLRARLALQSLVTGSAMIEVEFLPNTPIRLTGLDPRYLEIPTVQSPMGKLADILDHLDILIADPEIKEIISHLNVASGKLDRVLDNADRLVVDANSEIKGLAHNLNQLVDELSSIMENASKDLHGVASDARILLKNADADLKPIAAKMERALDSAQQALTAAKNTLSNISGFVGDRSDTRHKLNQTLDEIAGAARSLHSLMDYLERHPESLLQGKGGRGR
jgi:paraquat-inducible protein B